MRFEPELDAKDEVVADIRKTELAALAAIQPRVQEAERISSLVREARGNPPRSVDFDGVGVRADRVAVAAAARYTSQIESLSAAAANAAEAASVLDVADEALVKIETKLSRMAELAEEGALTNIENDDGTITTRPELSAQDRAILDAEFSDLRSEIDEIAADTSFNGIDLLQGDSDTPTDPLELSFKLGGAAGGASTVSVSLNAADSESLYEDLATASLSSESNSDAAVTAVEEAQVAVSDIRAAVRGARAQLDNVEAAAGEVSAVIERVRDVKVTPEEVVDLSRVVADRVTEEGGVHLIEGAQKILQDVMLRMSAATANGGPAAGGDGVEDFGGKTAGAPAAPSTGQTAESTVDDG